MNRETTVARKPVDDAEGAIQQAQEDMRYAETVGLTSRKPNTICEKMLNAIGDSLSDLAILNNEEDGDHVDDDGDVSEPNMLGEDDESG